MYCKYCGKEISEDSKYCRYCGEPQDQQKEEPEIEIAFLLQVTEVLHYSHEAMLKQR